MKQIRLNLLKEKGTSNFRNELRYHIVSIPGKSLNFKNIELAQKCLSDFNDLLNEIIVSINSILSELYATFRNTYLYIDLTDSVKICKYFTLLNETLDWILMDNKSCNQDYMTVNRFKNLLKDLLTLTDLIAKIFIKRKSDQAQLKKLSHFKSLITYYQIRVNLFPNNLDQYLYDPFSPMPEF